MSGGGAYSFGATTPVIVCSADLSQLRDNHDALAQDPRCWILPKPFSLDQFEETLDAAIGAPQTPDVTPRAPSEFSAPTTARL